jgi:ATP-dependent Clp protease ATP-binding subunit ClpB
MKYGIDFTERAKQGKLDPVIGRDTEIRRTIQILSRRTKNNPVLIGDPGVGKVSETACMFALFVAVYISRRSEY